MGWTVCGKECDCFRVYRKVGGLDHMMEKCVSASLFLSSGEIHRWGERRIEMKGDAIVILSSNSRTKQK